MGTSYDPTTYLNQQATTAPFVSREASAAERLRSSWLVASDWSVTTGAFTGTDRGLLRSVLGPWSPVPKCEAPGAPISVEEPTSMAPRPRRQSQNPPLQKSFAIPA